MDVDSLVARESLKANPAGQRVEVLRPDFLGLLRLSRRVVAHLDGTDYDYFARLIGIEIGLGVPERDLRLVDLDHALKGLALGVDHGEAELLGEEPSRLVGDRKLVLQLERRDAVRVGCHEVGRPEPEGQRQPGAVHDGAGGDRGLAAAGDALVGPGAALQQDRPAVATARADEALRPASREEEGGASSLVRERFLDLGQRAGVTHGWSSWRPLIVPQSAGPTLLWVGGSWDNGISRPLGVKPQSSELLVVSHV